MQLHSEGVYTPLHVAVIQSCCSVDMVQLLLESGADINAKDWKGRTPLDLCENFELQNYLTKNGAKKGDNNIDSIGFHIKHYQREPMLS